jgi:hypothetical protein
MRIVTIPKGGGRTRTIYVPSGKEKCMYHGILPWLQQAERRAAHNCGVSQVAHGFVKGRSPVTCALAHVGFQITVSCDLENWFDSVREEQIVAGLNRAGGFAWPIDLPTRLCVNGAPRQGLPTSPTAANLAAVPMDDAIFARFRSWIDEGFLVYTRYADDLTVSVRASSRTDATVIDIILAEISAAAGAMGWKIAERKTRVQHAKAGRRVIVGVSVGDEPPRQSGRAIAGVTTTGDVPKAIQPTREMRRRLRAARHNDKDSPQAKGLAEWSLLKRPKPPVIQRSEGENGGLTSRRAISFL